MGHAFVGQLEQSSKRFKGTDKPFDVFFFIYYCIARPASSLLFPTQEESDMQFGKHTVYRTNNKQLSAHLHIAPTSSPYMYSYMQYILNWMKSSSSRGRLLLYFYPVVYE